MDQLEYARARLRFFGAIAAAVRRASGLEYTARGYQLLRVKRMRRALKAPRDRDITVLRLNHLDGTAIIEFTDERNVSHQLEIPQIELLRHARKRAGLGAAAERN
jgi:hypothetical protein